MECVFGLVGDGFAIVIAGTSAVHSILLHKSNEDKIIKIDSHKLLGASGEGGDRIQFTDFIQKNVALYQHRNGISLSTSAAANFTSNELSTTIRKLASFIPEGHNFNGLSSSFLCTSPERRVPLSNGGSLMIEQTEALVSIDVNGGHGMLGKENSQEDAILEINLAAAKQVKMFLFDA